MGRKRYLHVLETQKTLSLMDLAPTSEKKTLCIRSKNMFFTFAKKVIFWVACVCMYICMYVCMCVEHRHNCRTPGWIVLIFGMCVGLDETWKRLDFGPPSGLGRYCSGTSWFDISSSEHAAAVIF